MMTRAARRRALSHMMTGLTVVAALLALLPLFAIFADLLIKGASSINWAFFVEIHPPPARPAAVWPTRSSAPCSSWAGAASSASP
jgi:ABC-type phosphate transport system permease subunit